MIEKRAITEIYIVHPIGSEEIIRVCSNFKLAYYYLHLLSKQYQECHDTTLTIDKYNLIHFATEKVEMSEDDYRYELEKLQEKIDIIKEVVND